MGSIASGFDLVDPLALDAGVLVVLRYRFPVRSVEHTEDLVLLGVEQNVVMSDTERILRRVL